MVRVTLLGWIDTVAGLTAYLVEVLVLPQRCSPGHPRRPEPVGRRPYEIFPARDVSAFESDGTYNEAKTSGRAERVASFAA